jgi:hypothetical protein
MINFRYLFSAFALLTQSCTLVFGVGVSNSTYDVLDYVDQLIGSSNGGLKSNICILVAFDT